MRLAAPRKGFDNTGELSVSTLRANGFSFALRYVSRYTAKVVSKQEAIDYRNEGIDLAVVFEDSATNALGGFAAGVSDAGFAHAQAVDRGMPKDRPIYFAVDFDVAGRPESTDSYFDGCAHVLGKGRCGPYGGIEVVRHQLDRGFKFAWQTYAWSRGMLDPRAQVYQYLNTNSWDYDHVYFDDFGQWSFKAKPVGPWRPDYSKFDPHPWEYKPHVHILEAETLQEHYGALEHPEKYHDWLAELSHRLVFLRKRVWREAMVGVNDAPAGFGIPHHTSPTWGMFHRGYRWKELLRATDPAKFRHFFPHDPHGAPLPLR